MLHQIKSEKYYSLELGAPALFLAKLTLLLFLEKIEAIISPRSQETSRSEDKPDFEKLHLINQLDEEDKNMIFRMVDKMLTTKKFKDFFNKNVAAL